MEALDVTDRDRWDTSIALYQSLDPAVMRARYFDDWVSYLQKYSAAQINAGQRDPHLFFAFRAIALASGRLRSDEGVALKALWKRVRDRATEVLSAPPMAPTSAAPVVPSPTATLGAPLTRAERTDAHLVNVRAAEAGFLLVRDGAAPWPHVHLADEAWSHLRDSASGICSGQGAWRQTERRGFELGVRAIPLATWRSILLPELLATLRAYLGCEPVIVAVEVVRVPPRAPPQKSHRDHNLGAHKELILGLSLDGTPITSLIALGSHADTAPAAASAFKKLVAASAGATGVLFDAYAVHAGAANASARPLTSRLFCVFDRGVQSCLASQLWERREIRRLQVYDTHEEVACAAVLAAVERGAW